MPNGKLKLTKTAVEKLCLPPADGETNSKGKLIGSLRYWDTELRGFGLEVYRSGRRTWFVQRDVGGKTRSRKVGSYPECTPDTARKWAAEILLEMGRGVDPNAREREEKASETTLAEAIEWHVAAMQAKDCAPRSIECMREDTARHLGDWMARPPPHDQKVGVRRAT